MGMREGFAIAVVLTTPLGAANGSTPVAADTVVPAGLEARILHEVAERWSRPSADIVIEWGALPDRLGLTDTTSFALRGGADNGWFVVVFPTTGRSAASVRLRAGTVAPSPVAARPLPRGHVLLPEDIAFDAETLWGPPFDNRTIWPEAGWTTTHALERGRSLRPPATRPPAVIAVGDVVELRWRHREMVIAVQGIALNTASIGDLVRVRLNNGRGSVRGVAAGFGIAEFESRGRR